MNLTALRPDAVSTAEWDAYLRLAVAREAGTGIGDAEDRFFVVCGSLERGLRVLSTIDRLKRETASKPSVLRLVDPDEFFGRPAPAVFHPQRSSGTGRVVRTAAATRSDRWGLLALTLVSLACCAYLLIETLRGVA